MSQDSVIRGASGRAVVVPGDDIDTDRIIPARFLRCVTFDGLGDHAFEDDRRGWKGADRHPFDRPERQGAKILVVGSNFGCGSSREHAPQSLKRWGIDGIVGVSFAEIFFGNCVSLGLPCVTLLPADIEKLVQAVAADPKLEVRIDLKARSVSWGAGETRSARIPDGARKAFLDGLWDSTSLLADRPEEIDQVASALPYVGGWN